jgi:6-phosphogluconolactonase
VSRQQGGHDVRVYCDEQALGAAAAAWVADRLVNRVRAHGSASFVLSGGSTPKVLYRLLGTRFKDDVPWPQVRIFWGDERYVPHNSFLSNYRMAKDTLLDAIGIPAANVYPMPTHFAEPEAAARDYEETLTDCFPGSAPLFDVVLLGIGEDGHTASVFTGSPAMTATRAVMAVTAPSEPSSRLTLTLPVIASARHIGILAAGAAKSPALAEALGSGDAATPAAVLARTVSTLIWWVDREAWAARHQGAPR